MAQRDPLKDILIELLGPDPGTRNKRNAQSAPESAVRAYRTFAPITVASAALAFYAPQLADTALTDTVDQAGQFITTVHGYRWPLAVLASAWSVLDILRWHGHRQRRALESQLRQTTRHLPVKVTVAFPPGICSLRSAKIRLPRGAIIRPKEMDEFTTAVRGAAGRTGTYTHTVRHHAHRDLILIARTPVEPDTRSPRHKALQTALSAGTIFKEPAVTVASRDEDGVETGYKITFTPSLNSGARGFQTKVDEALAALAGHHESGRTWATEWTPSEGYLVMYLRAPLPTRVDHPLALVDENLRHLPYATGAANLSLYWDVSTKSNKPHCLIVGPTGGGKTSVIRTLLTEASRRGIPFLGVDPKMIELDGLEGYPGCAAIVYDAVRSAMLVRALHAEMMARNHYVHVKKIEPSQLPLLIAVLDEFFILSGKWQRLAKDEDEEIRAQIKQLDPLGAWADLAVLARSAGIRLLLGVQRPDASLFGSSSGNARDNFGTRISLGNLSQDGALMMWGDAHVGREVDTSIPGRGVVTALDGSPVDAQMWWTPNVDPHPNKWNQLSKEEKAIVHGLTPTESPTFEFFSTELREFVESERALARRAREYGDAPEPSVLTDFATDHDTVGADDFADAIPASAVTEGMVILLDDDDGDQVPVTVDTVTVMRDKDTGDVLETVLSINTGGRVKTTVHFDATEVVMLPEPDTVLTTV
ncbi:MULTISPECIES: FtsK/SpoIIIE domain-containing protein [unclassified Rhodococcus (in: high G+C Gram-positive bacteria)]|uniref:FtsK/SpoIIIE domain-containing protein n=1 Tax=unclassified Rhodococcus (in: high G+C Gram-positive bacteria) TaxID=192944 RepID=UPI0002DB55B2|nr:FtsK/SpoIIIE domain-containing protein [Rhodococcus sp. DK17]